MPIRRRHTRISNRRRRMRKSRHRFRRRYRTLRKRMGGLPGNDLENTEKELWATFHACKNKLNQLKIDYERNEQKIKTFDQQRNMLGSVNDKADLDILNTIRANEKPYIVEQKRINTAQRVFLNKQAVILNSLDNIGNIKE